MTKVMIVGDTHADAQFVSNCLRSARELEVETVVQLGDFGFTFDANMIASISAWLEQDEDREFFWLDGNHDEHAFIEEVILGDVDNLDSPVEMRGLQFGKITFPERMIYCPRGSVTTIGEKRCLFMGGAYSIDKSRRTPYISWWPQEMIRYADVERAIANGARAKVDVMFTHDAPSSLYLESILHTKGYKNDGESFKNRQQLGVVIDHVRPDELYHGHMHYRYDAALRTHEGWMVDVHGVGANINSRGYIQHDAIFDENFIVCEF